MLQVPSCMLGSWTRAKSCEPRTVRWCYLPRFLFHLPCYITWLFKINFERTLTMCISFSIFPCCRPSLIFTLLMYFNCYGMGFYFSGMYRLPCHQGCFPRFELLLLTRLLLCKLKFTLEKKKQYADLCRHSRPFYLWYWVPITSYYYPFWCCYRNARH